MTTAQSFDWVTARFDCSLTKMWIRLKVGVTTDVNIRNGLRKEGAGYKFEIEENGQSFLIYREAGDFQSPPSVEFKLTAKGIEISSESSQFNILATVTLDREGQCKFSVSGQEWEEWHLRKFALEKLFFEP